MLAVPAAASSVAVAQKEPTTPENSVVEYSDLSQDAKATFQKALRAGDLQKPGTEMPRDLMMYTHVQYLGQRYSLQLSVSYDDRYTLRSTRTTREELRAELENKIGAKAESPDELLQKKGRVQSEDLAPRTRQLVQSSLSGQTVGLPSSPPESLIQNRFFRHQGDLYRLRLTAEDLPALTIQPSPVE